MEINYISCLSVPYRKFKRKAIKDCIVFKGITYYSFSQVDLDWGKMKLKQKAKLTSIDDETKKIVLWS